MKKEKEKNQKTQIGDLPLDLRRWIVNNSFKVPLSNERVNRNRLIAFKKEERNNTNMSKKN